MILWIFRGCRPDLPEKIYAMTGLYDYIRSALSKFIKSKGSDTDFYEVCSRMLQDKRTWKANDFHDICSSFRTGEVVLDNMLYECVGMSGDDVLARLRSGKPQITM